MLLNILHYGLNVTYRPGKYLYIADTLSRALLTENISENKQEFAYVVHTVSKYLPMSAEKKAEFQAATKNDCNSKIIVEFVKTNWPSDKKNTTCCSSLFQIKRFTFCSR